MSREIKFRGMSKNGWFAYGLLSRDIPNSTLYYDEYSQRICWHTELEGQANIPVKNGTVGQYTGLKDKNCVEVYEGDVVKTSTRVGTVVWDNDFCGFSLISERKDGKSEMVISHPSVIPCEVIGNIHQNPELLEK